MAEMGVDGKDEGGISHRVEFLPHGPRRKGEALFGDAQEPLIHDDIAAEGAAAQELATDKFLDCVREQLRQRIDTAVLALETRI